jgi:hypothetical protein
LLFGNLKELFKFINIKFGYLISNCLREFWVKATVLRLAVQAFSKQYCLSDTPISGERFVLGVQDEKQEPQNSLKP